MHDRAIHDATPADGIARDPLGPTGDDRLARAGQSSACGQQMKELTFETNQGSCPPTEKTQGAVGDRVEDRLDIGWRTRNDPEDLARGRLSVQRSGEIVIADLQLPEQSDVLDRDDRLIGEGLEKGDLLVGEGPDLGAAEQKEADRLSLSQQWYGHDGA